MRVVTLFLTLAGAAAAQSTLGSGLTLFRVRPDLVLLLVVTFSIVRGVEEGALAGLIGGLMVDCLSAIPFGASTLIMGAIGLATGLGEDNIYRANVVIPLIAVFLATILYHSFLMLTLQAAGWSVEWLGTLALQTVPGAFLNAMLAPLAIPLVRKMTAPSEETERMQW